MAYQTIARDNQAQHGVNAGTDSWSFTNNSGNLLVLGIGISILAGTDLVTAVTYNGVAMTRIGYKGNANGGGIAGYLYYLLAPATGSNTIAITATGATRIESYAASYTGVKQATPDATSTPTSATAATSIADTLTTVADNAIHIATYYVDAAAISSITNGTIIIGEMGESNPLLITPAGSNTMTANAISQNWVAIGASFAPAEVIPTGGAFFQFM